MTKTTAARTVPFALSLLSREVSAKPGKNVIVSPLSVSTALGMTANGARGNTLAGIVKALGFDGSDLAQLNAAYASLLKKLTRPGFGVTLDVANGIFAREGVGFHASFLDANRLYFGAEVKELDFNIQAAVDYINNWVKTSTKEKIRKLLEGGIDGNTIMLLLNAVYFKGEWNVKFDKEFTTTETFKAAGGNIQHPLMYRQGDFIYGRDWEDEVFQWVSLPFGDSKAVRMLVLLPSGENAVEDVLNVLTPEKFAQYSQADWSTDGELWLPRVDVAYENNLNDTLTSLGMADAFDACAADFSGLRPTPPNAFIKEVKHKTVFKIDEEGAEGAAITSVGIGCESARMPFQLRVDKPFVKFVVDSETDTVLFASVINDPTAQK